MVRVNKCQALHRRAVHHTGLVARRILLPHLRRESTHNCMGINKLCRVAPSERNSQRYNQQRIAYILVFYIPYIHLIIHLDTLFFSFWLNKQYGFFQKISLKRYATKLRLVDQYFGNDANDNRSFWILVNTKKL